MNCRISVRKHRAADDEASLETNGFYRMFMQEVSQTNNEKRNFKQINLKFQSATKIVQLPMEFTFNAELSRLSKQNANDFKV